MAGDSAAGPRDRWAVSIWSDPGAGVWHRAVDKQLARYDKALTGIDISPEVLALNRVRSGTVHDQQCNIFQWEPAELYDFIFFGFWVACPPSRFEAFWQKVRTALAPGGNVFCR